MEQTPVQENQTTSSSGVTISEGKGGLFGIKAGMAQVYNDQGDALAVTVIDLAPNTITQVKKTSGKEGYNALQVALLPKKEKNVTKAEKGHFSKSGKSGYSFVKEIRLPNESNLDAYQVGQTLSPEFIQEGDLIDVTAVSKGKGFQGVMKRYHFAGGYASHGASVCHRSGGSIGSRTDYGKVFKGKKMAGHMGHEKVTVQNVRVVKVDQENNLLLVHGSVPGPRSSVVTIRRSVKKLKQAKKQA